MDDILRTIIGRTANLAVPVSTLDEHADLYAAGLSSLATVHVMLAVEQAFDIEFPDHALARRTFGSIAALSEVVDSLHPGRQAA